MICPLTLRLNIWTRDGFHGDAIALRDTTGETEYLVCDQSMPAPVWVRSADVVSHSTVGEATRPPAPEPKPEPELEPEPEPELERPAETVVGPQHHALTSEELSQLSDEELGQRMAELRKLAGLDDADA